MHTWLEGERHRQQVGFAYRATVDVFRTDFSNAIIAKNCRKLTARGMYRPSHFIDNTHRVRHLVLPKLGV